MILNTPRLRDEPRDGEGRDEGLLSGLHLRLHHRILGDVVKPTIGGVRASPKDDCGMPWADCTKSLKRCGEAIERKASTRVDQRGKNAPALKIDGEDAGTMRGQRNRDARYAEIRRDTPSLPRGFVTAVTRVNNTGSTLRKKKNGRAGMIRICYVYLPCSIFLVVCFYLCHSYLCSFVSCCYLTC